MRGKSMSKASRRREAHSSLRCFESASALSRTSPLPAREVASPVLKPARATAAGRQLSGAALAGGRQSCQSEGRRGDPWQERLSHRYRKPRPGGYRTTRGAEAPYDVFLMDVQMPVLDGLETTRLLRRNPKWEEAPIIAMTAHAMSGDRERCLEAGRSAYISKPVQPAHLVSTVERYLEATASPAQSELSFTPAGSLELLW